MSKKALALISLFSGMLQPETGGNNLSPKYISVNIPPVIPKGCKEYFFAIDGRFSTEKMLRSECVFKCVASNEKNAIRKFNKWAETK